MKFRTLRPAYKVNWPRYGVYPSRSHIETVNGNLKGWHIFICFERWRLNYFVSFGG